MGYPDGFLIRFFLVLLLIIFWMLIPLSGAILTALVIGIAFYPTHLRLSRHLRRWSPSTRAVVTDVTVLFFLIVPTVLLIWVLIHEAQSLAPTMKQMGTTVEQLRQGQSMESVGVLRRTRDWLYNTLGIQPAQFRRQVMLGADKIVTQISSAGPALARHSFGLIFDSLIVQFTLFFIFRDGPHMWDTFPNYVPLSPSLKTRLANRFQSTVVGVLRGWVLTSLVQGLTASLGYFIVGFPAVAMFGVLTAITGLIPSVGTALVWFPIAMMYIFQHTYWKGIFLIVWGILIVGILDNFLRPYLMKEKADLPFLALFFAILGGVEAWGTMGFILGPLLLAITPLIADAYRRRFLSPGSEGSEKRVA